MSGQSILVVGGSSTAAVAFRHRLAKIGRHRVTVAVRKAIDALPGEEIVTVPDYFEFLAGKSFGDIDAGVNFVGVTNSRSEAEFDRVNHKGVERMGHLAKAYGIGQFVHISSLSVYGGAADIDRATPERPVTPYGRSKLAGDRALLALADPDFVATILRVPILFGPHSGKKLHQLARFLLRFGMFPVPPAFELRSVLHVDNLAVAIMAAIEQRLSGVQFAADPEPFRLDALAAMVGRRRGGVTLVRLPSLFFLPIKTFLPQTYNSIYGRSLIHSDQTISLPVDSAKPMDVTLCDLLPERVTQ
jgi:nucleoside-diphosphate-sugar epimerase